MKGDLIIKDVDLEQLEKDLETLDMIHYKFTIGENRYPVSTYNTVVRVLGMLKTWAEGRKAEKEDEELAESLTTSLMMSNIEKPIEIKTAVLYALKEQRKRLGK